MSNMIQRYRRKTLNEAGVDADRYLSLHIDRSVIPDGAEVIVQVRDKETGDLRPVELSEVWDGCFGKNSRFYGQMMSDGNIFNPYIHRRFLPAQFQRNVRQAGYSGIEKYVRENYGWNYVTRFLREECEKLAMLQRRDKEAYEERSRFFTLNDMKRILIDYSRVVRDVVECAVRRQDAVPDRRGRKPKFYCIEKIGAVQREHVRPMLYRYEKFPDEVNNCRSYAQLSKLLNGFKFDPLGNHILPAQLFAKCFIASGAYFTMKHMIMFEGLKLGKHNVKQDLDYLRSFPVDNYMMLYKTNRL